MQSTKCISVEYACGVSDASAGEMSFAPHYRVIAASSRIFAAEVSWLLICQAALPLLFRSGKNGLSMTTATVSWHSQATARPVGLTLTLFICCSGCLPSRAAVFISLTAIFCYSGFTATGERLVAMLYKSLVICTADLG